MKTSEAQLRAVKKYKERNREATRISNYRSSARTFVRHHATEDDMNELLEIFKNENKNKKGSN